MVTFRFATGCEPGKWIRRFQERTSYPFEAAALDDPLAELLDGSADLALVRLPDRRFDADTYHRVVLYDEAPGVAVPKDSVFAELGEPVSVADLDGEIVNYRLPESCEPDIPAIRAALQVVAANVGVVYAPLPILRMLSGKQVVPLPLDMGAGSGAGPDAGSDGAATLSLDVPLTHVALIWHKDRDCDAIQDFVGVTRGRTPGSHRQRAASPNRSRQGKNGLPNPRHSEKGQRKAGDNPRQPQRSGPSRGGATRGGRAAGGLGRGRRGRRR